jgi:hypothetical protein
MNPTGTWLVSEIVQAVQEFEVGYFPFSSIGGSGISPPAEVGTGWFVAKDAKNPEGLSRSSITRCRTTPLA